MPCFFLRWFSLAVYWRRVMGLPNFFSKKALWEPLVFSGFSVAADPQVMTWYPLASFFASRKRAGFISPARKYRKPSSSLVGAQTA
jgi:hypothetical protein